ncbi:DMT family transporter [Actinoallomurus bryophytorum]|uniref:Drug/metabolite transporter (DMT)-like permease n=1 Tax=Actinoallomurus bryophytorum TaxID=1490222 RepID=A0A543CG06_9ACTN|nr:DMT family transporter [Actinoallomurus bryophytorum]TQL96056.1 drug/metabolite transporter (DMT)-like permease [Actinoallomurus bryophytorum]
MNNKIRTPALVLAALLWGGSAAFTKYALDTWQPMTLLTVELAGASVVLWTAVLIRGHRRPAVWRRLVLLGALEPGLCYAFVNLGLTHTSASNGIVLSGLESGFVVVLAAVFLRERLAVRSVAGLAVALAGVLVLEGARPEFTGVFGGDLLVLSGIFCAAVYVLVARRTADQVDALTMTAYQFASGFLFFLPFSVGEWVTGAEKAPLHQSAWSWLVATGIGVGAYACSFLLYNFAIARVSAGRAAMILNLMPVFGVLIAVIFLREHPGAWQLVGAAMIIGSIFVFPEDEEEPETPGEVAAPPLPVDGAR